MAVLTAFSVQGKDPVLMTRFYIAANADKAVEQMVEFRIPASVILAQAIFESRCGMSELALKSNNHFGIKCHMEWGGDTVRKTDDAYNECFRKYSTVEESYTDHSMFLKSRARYAHLFDLPVTDYKSWCYGLKAAGYATFPKYAEELIRIIEENQLYLLDVTEAIESDIIIDNDTDLNESIYFPDYFTLKEMAASDVLFLEERDALVQSLSLIVEAGSEAEDVVAEK